MPNNFEYTEEQLLKISNNNRKFVDAVLGLANNTIGGELDLSK